MDSTAWRDICVTKAGLGSLLSTMSQPPTSSTGGPRFSDLGVSPRLLAILDQLRFTVPTPIQLQAIPVAAEGKDVIGIAQTGTGKTLAFVLPLIQQVAARKRQGLIIAPTRELALQIDEVVGKIGQTLGVRRALLIGGASMQQQIVDVRRRPHVLIGTPGRIIDHLEGGRIHLEQVGVLVLDEADRMLDMGFAPQIKRILAKVPHERQTLLFSATMPADIVKIAAMHMQMPVRVEVARAGTVAQQVDQELFIVRREDKLRLLDKLLDTYQGTVLVFSRTKYGAKKICRAVREMGHSVAEIHSNLSLPQRRRALAGFKSGQFRVLVATDIAARGIDVTNISAVINFDLPDNAEDYVHRVGRTGRAGQPGQAVSFVTPDQRGTVRDIERLVRAALAISPLPELPAARHVSVHQSDNRRRRGDYQQANRGRRANARNRREPAGGGRGRDSRRRGAPARGASQRARVHL
ncbi:MAG: ATP-dependent helicase [Candidatus Andersenbacteria bacterium CG10_big_fil_rev_8_21_14_0_10_54_11]|uniref:ATP-dependent helicase n=1 Tax=Candidatus Andersenbacteria bacterium CG10_big_fil_rev_8_21_14_0_10_54_11 TaxID=1974485 RepID=A0A2M6WYS6_9BACT|nr:MAG: ATP-dependent helicase [Candidatus Andersenbacteria bacterium CG10_big_fil_rev_8_21_14_0_10_54_11]